MNILIASDSFAPKIDGVADTTALVARLLAAGGHRVRVVAPGPGPTLGEGFAIIRLPSMRFPFYPELRLAWPWGRLAPLLRAEPPDAAVVLTSGPVGLAAVRALPSKTRLIHIYTTDIPRYLRAYGVNVLSRPAEAILQRISARAAVTLCPTEVVRGELAERGYRRLAVWGRGVDTDLFRPDRRSATIRQRLTGGEPDKPLVLYVGRLAREKRLLDLYQAALRLQGLRFAIVGNGPQRDILEQRFSRVRAVFTGYLRGPALATAFASADIFAFPSDTETFGQVVLQAMASGIPPVVVEGTAPAEFVPHGVAGLHVPARRPDVLAAAIDYLAHDQDARIAMGKAAIQHAHHYAWPALVARLEAMLAGTAERNSWPVGR